jgi:hypothetical protein
VDNHRFAVVKIFNGLPEGVVEYETKADAEQALRKFREQLGEGQTQGSCVTNITQG